MYRYSQRATRKKWEFRESKYNCIIEKEKEEEKKDVSDGNLNGAFTAEIISEKKDCLFVEKLIEKKRKGAKEKDS